MLINIICYVIDFKCFDDLRVNLGLHQRVSLTKQNRNWIWIWICKLQLRRIRVCVGCKLPCRRFRCRTRELSEPLSPFRCCRVASNNQNHFQHLHSLCCCVSFCFNFTFQLFNFCLFNEITIFLIIYNKYILRFNIIIFRQWKLT